MKMLKFTNSTEGRKGDPIFISNEWIVAVYEDHTPGGSLYTVIYGGPAGVTWNVEESLNEVMNIIRGSE